MPPLKKKIDQTRIKILVIPYKKVKKSFADLESLNPRKQHVSHELNLINPVSPKWPFYDPSSAKETLLFKKFFSFKKLLGGPSI